MSTEKIPRGAAIDAPAATEVREPTGRRVYSAEYKRGILAEIDVAPHGSVGAILRREGIYMSMIRNWRSQAATGGSARQPGVKPSPLTPMKKENERLKRENQRLLRKLEQAELIIAVQKKISRLMSLSDDEITETSSS